MTVGTINNWANLNVTGTIRPDSIDTPSLKVNGSPVTASNGTVTTLSVVTANGVSGTVANATTAPAITLTLGDISPSSVNSTFTGNLTGNASTATVAGSVPTHALAALPNTTPAGTVIYVSDATRAPSGTGTLCFSDGTNWIDVTTGAAVV